MVIEYIVPKVMQSFECRTCGAQKAVLDDGDRVELDALGEVKGTWHCPNGHANAI